MGSGGLNLLVNNAGILFKEGMLDCSAEDMQKSFDTNVMGPMNIMKVSKRHTLRTWTRAQDMTKVKLS